MEAEVDLAPQKPPKLAQNWVRARRQHGTAEEEAAWQTVGPARKACKGFDKEGIIIITFSAGPELSLAAFTHRHETS